MTARLALSASFTVMTEFRPRRESMERAVRAGRRRRFRRGWCRRRDHSLTWPSRLHADRYDHDDGAVRLVVADHDYRGWVEQLADPIRAKRAHRHLLLSGRRAFDAVFDGLTDERADVRWHCTRLLDRLVDADSLPLLNLLLDDPDLRVRRDALHALACDRCKQDDTCRPAKDDVLPDAHTRTK